MANKLCIPTFKVQNEDYVRITVPTGQTYYAGDVVVAETLNTDITDNIEVYSPTPVSDITSEYLCIVISNAGFEEYDGRRIEGNPDYSTYSYSAGKEVNAIRLKKNQTYIISDDSINVSTALAVGVKLIGSNGTKQLTSTASPGSALTVLNIEVADESIENGGNMGINFIDANRVRVTAGY